MFDIFAGYKTYLAALGLLGLSAYQFSVERYAEAFETLMAAIAAFGIRNAIARQ